MDLLMLRRRAILGMNREEYIVFADPVVEQICATNWGDGVGITPSQAKRVTTLGTTFQSNTQIQSFDELEYFTGLVGVSNNAFNGCTNLLSVVLPQNVTTIGTRSFYNCSSLSSINLGEIYTISEGAFENCTNLEIELSLPHLTSLARRSFIKAGVKKVLSLGSITTLGGTQSNPPAFNNCTKLTDIVLPNTLTAINDYAFYNCTAIERITLPTSIVSIGSQAFYNAFSSTCTVDINLPNLTSIGSRAFQNSKITKITSLGSITYSYNIFNGCTRLTEVYIPLTMTAIGEGAFYNCSSLTTVHNVSHIVSMASDCFRGDPVDGEWALSNLETAATYLFTGGKSTITKLVLPKLKTTSGTNTDGSGSFAVMKELLYVDIGPDITSLGKGTFLGDTLLETVIIRATTPPTLNANVFKSTNKTFKIYVPNGYGATYQAASGWSTYASRIYELDANGNIPA